MPSDRSETGSEQPDPRYCPCCGDRMDTIGGVCDRCFVECGDRQRCGGGDPPVMTDGGHPSTGTERFHLCMTCGRLKHEDLFEEGAPTCNDCRASGRHEIHFVEARDGEGFVKPGWGDGDV